MCLIIMFLKHCVVISLCLELMFFFKVEQKLPFQQAKVISVAVETDCHRWAILT